LLRRVSFDGDPIGEAYFLRCVSFDGDQRLLCFLTSKARVVIARRCLHIPTTLALSSEGHSLSLLRRPLAHTPQKSLSACPVRGRQLCAL
jgi:hypothetical protein